MWRGENLRLGYPGRVVADGLDLVVPGGAVTVLVGPNACGKSTVLRALARQLRPDAGTVYFDGVPIDRFGARELARRVALLPQSPLAPDGITVRELVARGRTPHQRWWRQWSRADEAVVAGALAVAGVAALADRPVRELSGGQRQRAWLAMALAQDTGALLLDEPTTFLDPAYQLDVLELVVRRNREHGRTVVMVLHDLNQACRYADHLIAMRDGRVVAAGAPAAVVTPGLVAEVFALESRVLPCPVTGAPMVVPVRRVAS